MLYVIIFILKCINVMYSYYNIHLTNNPAFFFTKFYFDPVQKLADDVAGTHVYLLRGCANRLGGHHELLPLLHWHQTGNKKTQIKRGTNKLVFLI